jgi:oligopeptidase A
MSYQWSQFLPMKLEPTNQHPCQFSIIFSDNFSASYYSQIWSNMLACDVLKAFTDVGLSNDTEIRSIGESYKDTFLKNGASIKTNDLYQKFRGRKYSSQSFIDYYTQ